MIELKIMEKFAVIQTGGKQYPVLPNQILEIEKIEGKKGKALVLDKVLLLVKGKEVKIGTPFLKGTKVKAEIVEQFKDKKIRIAKFRAKSRYRKVKGHRQQKTRIKIIDICEK